MKETRKQSTEKLLGLWNELTSNIKNKLNNKENISDQENTGDMGNTHTPISRLDLTGMNREQAKEVIGKLIDERLEEISHLELTELKINYKEKEKQRAEAAERINERRKRRKQKPAAAETIITDEGVYSDYKHSSVFDVIQPEAFPYELEKAAEPIEGQISIMEAMTAAEQSAEIQPIAVVERDMDQSTEYGPSFDLDHITKLSESQDYMSEPVKPANFKQNTKKKKAKLPAEESIIELETESQTLVQESTELPAEKDPVSINTKLDETIDKVFAFYEKYKSRLIKYSKIAHQNSREILNNRVLPAVARGSDRVNQKVMPLLQRAEAKLELKKKTLVIILLLAQKEKVLSDKMYHFIVFVDRMNELFIEKLIFIKDKIRFYYNRVKAYAESHKKKLLIEFGIGIAAISIITLVIGSMTAYEYVYNGKILGVVKNQEDVYKTIDLIGDKLSQEYDAEITIDKDKDIRFNKVIAFNLDVDNKEDILNRLTYMRDMRANGRGIFVDGKMVAILESEETANEILSEIKNKYVKNDANIQYKKVGFAEDVTIKAVETKLGNIESKDKALEYLMTGAVEKKIHAVQSGETFSEIAKMYGLKQSELKASNPDVIPEKLQIGQEISLNQIVPLVSVQTVEVVAYKQVIPFEIAYENTGNLFKNEQTVKSKGSNGEKDVVAEVVRNNGIEVSRTEISSTILTQPVSQVVLVGTKEPPPLIGTGTFIYPIRGTLTSRYGTRWGRLHSGIDLAASIGTDIKAADGGKVTFAGYNGSLGYMVEIDHGGGRVTWYGHCSKLFVKKGDRVYQGQHIADVGNTGRSTGPHVHFEVHINGNSKNPLNYL